MTLRWQCLDIDSADPRRAADFWQEALGWRRTHESDQEVVLEPPAGSPEDGVGPDLLFLRVPEGKTVKNRLHLDLRPDDQQAELARLLGARCPSGRHRPGRSQLDRAAGPRGQRAVPAA